MSYKYRYVGSDGQDLVVESKTRRWDLEGQAVFVRVDDEVPAVEVPASEGEHVLSAETADEVTAEPVAEEPVEAPKKATRRRRKTTEVEG